MRVSAHIHVYMCVCVCVYLRNYKPPSFELINCAFYRNHDEASHPILLRPRSRSRSRRVSRLSTTWNVRSGRRSHSRNTNLLNTHSPPPRYSILFYSTRSSPLPRFSLSHSLRLHGRSIWISLERPFCVLSGAKRASQTSIAVASRGNRTEKGMVEITARLGYYGYKEITVCLTGRCKSQRKREGAPVKTQGLPGRRAELSRRRPSPARAHDGTTTDDALVKRPTPPSADAASAVAAVADISELE